MSFIAQEFDSFKVVAILVRRTHTTIRNHSQRYSRSVRHRVKVITTDMFSPYYQLTKQLLPNAKIVLDCFHIVQHMKRAISLLRVNHEPVLPKVPRVSGSQASLETDSARESKTKQ